MIHNFTYLGKSYEKLDAAYDYRKHQLRLADVKGHFQFLFDANIDFLKEEFNISYEDAISPSLLEDYVVRFEAQYDCDIPETAQWELAIQAVLREINT